MPAKPSWKPRLLVLAISLAFYLTACALPAMTLENRDVWYGWATLLMGWMGLFIGQFGWLANFPYLAALITLLCRQWRTTAILTAVAFLIGLHAFALLNREIPLDEGGVNKGTIVAIGMAPWVWLASIVLPGVGALMLRERERSRPPLVSAA